MDVIQPHSPDSKQVRVYCDGVFDLFHYGHAELFKQVKELFNNVYLIVGVMSDDDTKKYKHKTVMTAKERARSIQHCKWVDEVIIDPPWVTTKEFLEKHAIDYLAHDDQSYSVDIHYKDVIECGKFLTTRRTDGISTTDIKQRVLKYL